MSVMQVLDTLTLGDAVLIGLAIAVLVVVCRRSGQHRRPGSEGK